MGLYITTADAGANLVEFCPAEPFATLSIVRGYRDPGACRDGAAPLLKPIVAKSGDVVEAIRTRNLREWSTSAEHGAALQGHQRQASRSVAIRTVSSSTPEPSGLPPPIIRAASTAATLARFRLRPFAIG